MANRPAPRLPVAPSCRRRWRGSAPSWPCYGFGPAASTRGCILDPVVPAVSVLASSFPFSGMSSGPALVVLVLGLGFPVWNLCRAVLTLRAAHRTPADAESLRATAKRYLVAPAIATAMIAVGLTALAGAIGLVATAIAVFWISVAALFVIRI